MALFGFKHDAEFFDADFGAADFEAGFGEGGGGEDAFLEVLVHGHQLGFRAFHFQLGLFEVELEEFDLRLAIGINESRCADRVLVRGDRR